MTYSDPCADDPSQARGPEQCVLSPCVCVSVCHTCPQGLFTKQMEGFLIEMYLKEKAMFWGAAAAEQIIAQQQSATSLQPTGAIRGLVLTSAYVQRGCTGVPRWQRAPAGAEDQQGNKHTHTHTHTCT